MPVDRPPTARAAAQRHSRSPHGRRLLILTRYGDLGASSRLRILQFLPYLADLGLAASVRPFFDNRYLSALYGASKRPVGEIASAYGRRLSALRGAGRYDLIWVEKETFPFLPGLAEALLPRLGAPVVADYDDAIFHRYDLHRVAPVRWALGRKLAPLLRGARLVTAGNRYLADYAGALGAQQVETVPTVVDLGRYRASDPPAGRELRIGWIGSPATSDYLRIVRRALEQLARERPIRLVTVGAGPLPTLALPLERHPWSERTESSVLAGLHLGIMPLPDAPWERGKCGYKLIQYMACARPVVASPVGANTDIVSADLGLLAQGDAQWLAALRRLADDPGLRRSMGEAGRRKVEAGYSLQLWGPKLAARLSDLCA